MTELYTGRSLSCPRQSWAAIPVIGAELKFTIEDTRQVTSSLCGGQQNQIPPSQGQLGALPLGAGACF